MLRSNPRIFGINPALFPLVKSLCFYHLYPYIFIIGDDLKMLFNRI